jgi:hypothetical protein
MMFDRTYNMLAEAVTVRRHLGIDAACDYVEQEYGVYAGPRSVLGREGIRDLIASIYPDEPQAC